MDKLKGDYIPPEGSEAGLGFRKEYAPPTGNSVGLGLRFVWYHPPAGNQVGLGFSGAYTPPAGNQVGLNFTNDPDDDTPREGQYTFPVGWDSSAYSNQSNVYNKTHYLLSSGWRADVYGRAEVYNNARLIHAGGFAADEFGQHDIQNLSQGIFAESASAGARLGDPELYLWDTYVHAAGWRSEAYGTGKIENLTRYITTGGIRPRLAFGRPSIANLNRYLTAGGIHSLRVGTVTITHETRYIYPVMPSRLAFGRAWFSHSPRTISAGDLYATKTGHPVVAGTRHVGAIGWDSQAFGTRIIPEIQTVYPLGMAGELGWPTIYNHDWHVTPKGFITTVNEADRYGTAYFFNSRQYLEAFHSEASDAVGEIFGIWTEIKNRNRYVTTHGHDSQAVPAAYVENTARTIELGGADSLKFGTLFIAAGERELLPPGMEPPYISAWTAVINGAKVLEPFGFDASSVPAGAYLENTRRHFQRIGNFDSQALGNPYVDFGKRTIVVERRYSIEPPLIHLPLVDYRVKHIEPDGLDRLNMGEPFLHIRWNKLYPRTGDLSQYGWPEVRNLTPELYFHGKDMQEHGEPSVHLYSRYITPDGPLTQQFGRAHARDKRSWVMPMTQDFSKFSNTNRVYNERPDPPGDQRILPYSIPRYENDLRAKFGEPALNQQAVYHRQSQESLRFGSSEVVQNVIRMNAGIYDHYATGTPRVSLKNRKVSVEGNGIVSGLGYGKPRLTPFTIWATADAPQQAKTNHHPPGNPFRPVGMNSSGSWNKGLGRPVLSLQHRYITRVSAGRQTPQVGSHRIFLQDVYIYPEGWRHTRVGWHEVPHFIREVEQFNSTDFAAFGRPTVKRPPYTGPQEIKPRGFAGAFGQQRVEHFHREVEARSFNSMAMGASGSGPRYMRQRLWVGEPDWPHMQGFDVSGYGEHWISFKVREVKTEGDDHLVMDYDLQDFANRMRVEIPWWEQPEPEQPDELFGAGFDDLLAGIPSIRNAVHIIKPDGNAEVYRKGAGHG